MFGQKVIPEPGLSVKYKAEIGLQLYGHFFILYTLKVELSQLIPFPFYLHAWRKVRKSKGAHINTRLLKETGCATKVDLL